MRIKILNDIIEIENTKNNLEEAIVTINEIINKSGMILSSIKINTVEIYNDFYECLIDNLDTIEEVDIFLKSKNALIKDSLNSIEEYLERIFLKTDFLIDKLYTEVDVEFWDVFEQYLEGLQSILKILEGVRRNADNIVNFEVFITIETSIIKIITNLNTSIENGDRTNMIDIIKYELERELKKLNSEIIKLGEF